MQDQIKLKLIFWTNKAFQSQIYPKIFFPLSKAGDPTIHDNMYGKPLPFPNLDEKSVRTVLTVHSSPVERQQNQSPEEKRSNDPSQRQRSHRASPGELASPAPLPCALVRRRLQAEELQAPGLHLLRAEVRGRHPHKPQRSVASAAATSLQFRLGGSLRCAAPP